MTIEEIEVEPPRKGEVRVKLIATGVCHTDYHAYTGHNDEANFPCILGHEGAGIVESVGEGVKDLRPGDHVIPLYISECRECTMCKNGDTNLCSALSSTQGKGVMPDGTSRFKCKGKTVYHFMGTSTFAEYTVLPEISCALINPKASLESVCLLGCGISTGYGAAVNTLKVKKDSTVAVWGLGCVGLAAVMGRHEDFTSTCFVVLIHAVLRSLTAPSLLVPLTFSILMTANALANPETASAITAAVKLAARALPVQNANAVTVAAAPGIRAAANAKLVAESLAAAVLGAREAAVANLAATSLVDAALATRMDANVKSAAVAATTKAAPAIA
ncbi:unnamed protein product [Symbiodinium sp. KB8]|nr:unnamed protein product [Symbiodinium sp. KB8]